MPTEKGQASVRLVGQIGGSKLFQRSRYFTGKYMAKRDFEDEQAYMVGRRRLHNRLLHGWGILDGLEVQCHPDPNCASRWVVVQPGAALDCYGRELLLTEEQEFALPLPGEQKKEGQPEVAPVPSPFLLCLCYEETETEFVPALYAEGAYSKTTQANRFTEGAQLKVIRLDAAQEGSWPGAAGRDGLPKDMLPGGAAAQEPGDCPCGEMVPLALITYDGNQPDAGFEIWTTGRRRLFVPARQLTHIIHVNWPHGGELTLAQLRDDLHGRLEVTFDRKLRRAARAPGTGVSRDTFVVQRGGSEGELHMLRHHHEYQPALSASDDYCAVFTIEPDLLREDRQNLAGSLVRVTLRCDFILDAYGYPVDGNHLGGRLPTGDGVAGGTFESWFRVAPASEEEREKQRREAVEAQIRQRERRLKAVQDEAAERIAQREEAINQLQEQVEVDESEQQSARYARRELRERIERLEAEMREIREDAEHRLADRESEIAELRERADRARGEEREELRARIRELTENQEEIRVDAERRIDHLRHEVQELRGAAAEAGGEVHEESDEIRYREARIAALHSEIDTLSEERDREVERLSEEIKQLKATLQPGKKGGKG